MFNDLSAARWRLRAEGACAVVIAIGLTQVARAAWSPAPEPAPGPNAENTAQGAEEAPADPAPGPADAAPRRLRFRAPNGALEVKPGGPCAASARLPGGMNTLTDEALLAVNLSGHSPLVLLLDGAPVPRRADGEPCAAGVRLEGRTMSWDRPGAAVATVTLDPALPLQGAAGTSWWVYSGSGAAWDVELQPGDALALAAITVGGKPEALPAVVIGDQRLPIAWSGREAALEAPVGQGASELVIDVPMGGPHLVLQSLTLIRGEARIDLLAAP